MFEVFNWKYLNAKQKQFIVFILTLIPIGIFVLFEGINQYSDLLVVSNNSIGIMLFIKLLIYIFSLLIVKQLLIKDTNLKEMMEIKYRSRAAALYYFCGIILTFLGYFFSYVDRIGLVFYLFEGVHIGKTIKFANNPVNRRFFIFLEMLILLFYYVKLLLEGAQGVVPYFFVWQA